MAKLHVNRGLNLTLDASTTDFIVKSLSGPNDTLLLNGRNWGVEIRIDEDNYGWDIFRITKGPNGSTTLFTVWNDGSVTTNGILNVGGFDLKLGTSDQSSRGNSGQSRALVKFINSTLVINFEGDFTGGTRVEGPGLGVGSTNYIYNTTVSYQIPGANANAKWLIVGDNASGSGVISFNNTKDSDGNILGSIVWTREGGQADGHRQVAGIVAAQSGTGAIAGSELRFYVKGSAGPYQAMVINRGGKVGIGVSAPTERLETDGNVKASRFISTAPAGVSPLQVYSTTKVDNLNADLLDGYDSSDFPRKAEDAIISGTWTFSKTGVAPFNVSSAVKVNNLNADLLDGYDAADFTRKNENANITGTWTFNALGVNKPNPEYRLVVEEAGNRTATAIRKTNNGNGGNGSLDGPTLLVENSYGNHSYGNLAEFRIADNGTFDPPNITFTAGWASTGWSVGMAGSNDADFGIVSNRGPRFNSFGTLQLRVKPDGQLITTGTITPGISPGFAGHINGSGPIKFVNGGAAQEIYVKKVRASASWAVNDANDPGDGGGFFSGNLLVNGSFSGSSGSFSNNLSVGSNLLVGGQVRFGDKRIINVYVDHGGDTNTRYYYLGKVSTGSGILKVQGIMGGHTPDEGRANVDVQFSARSGFRVDGEVIGKLGRADIWVYAPSGDSFIYLYLVTKTWALVNLELSSVGVASIEFDGGFSYSAPAHTGSLVKLSETVNVLRYNSFFDGSGIPVTYSAGTGVTINGSFSFDAYAFMMGPFALIIIVPSYVNPNSGFSGEGQITLTMPLTTLKNALALNSAMFPWIRSVQLTVHQAIDNIYSDNQYNYFGPFYDVSNDRWGIQVYRPKFTYDDAPNLLHAWILATI